MTPERWQKVEAVLQGALDCPLVDRAGFLDTACGDDEDLKKEACSLVDAYDEAGGFMEQPAMAQDAHILLGGNIAREVGPYAIIRRLGSGGMGDVYLAHDRRLERQVALKILPAYLASDDARLRRFQTEARAASALNHPNILTIHEVGAHDDIHFIATEFIDGQTLRELMDLGLLTIDEILDIISQTSSALAAAHAAGIIHRDIKPENIMRRADGLVKILDFGIAKLIEQKPSSDYPSTQADPVGQTEVGAVMGTVNYMSPEQTRALELDQRTDIWSLGVVLYEMLMHRLPFTGVTRMDTLVSIIEREPQIKAEPTQLRPFVRFLKKALCKDREGRYHTADEMLRDLNTIKLEIDPAFRATAFGDQPNIETRPRWAWLVVALTLALVGGAIVWKLGFMRPRESVATVPATPTKEYSQMSEAEKLAFVASQEQRISTMMGDRPLKLNEEALQSIKRHIDWYVDRNGSLDATLGEQNDERLKAIYQRAQFHVPLIARAFAARKVPVIIGIYLPVIESAYRDCYENQIGAKGLFQFLPQTARDYGVAHDQMCDVAKMAPAAAHYLADRMAELGEDSQSLTLVLLSYNRGPESVREDLRVLRDTPNYQRNFWTLFAHRDQLDEQFRKESVGYVPTFFAAAIIGENPDVFGLTTPSLSSVADAVLKQGRSEKGSL